MFLLNHCLEEIHINPPFNNLGTQENAISRIIEKIAADLQASKPTRAVLLIPIFEGMDGPYV